MFSTPPVPPNLPIQLIELNGVKFDPESSLRAVARPGSFYKDYDFPYPLTQVSHPFRGEAKEPPYRYDKARVFARTNRNGTENVSLHLDLRIKKLFPVLRVRSHLTAAGTCKWDGYAPSHLMFVVVTLAFLKITSVHEVMKQAGK